MNKGDKERTRARGNQQGAVVPVRGAVAAPLTGGHACRTKGSIGHTQVHTHIYIYVNGTWSTNHKSCWVAVGGGLAHECPFAFVLAIVSGQRRVVLTHKPTAGLAGPSRVGRSAGLLPEGAARGCQPKG